MAWSEVVKQNKVKNEHTRVNVEQDKVTVEIEKISTFAQNSNRWAQKCERWEVQEKHLARRIKRWVLGGVCWEKQSAYDGSVRETRRSKPWKVWIANRYICFLAAAVRVSRNCAAAVTNAATKLIYQLSAQNKWHTRTNYWDFRPDSDWKVCRYQKRWQSHQETQKPRPLLKRFIHEPKILSNWTSKT